jgi:hypothetical protein
MPPFPSFYHISSLLHKLPLGWITGKLYEPDYMYRAFSALGVTRTLSKAGYARFRDFLLYGERNLAGEKVHINVFQNHPVSA